MAYQARVEQAAITVDGESCGTSLLIAAIDTPSEVILHIEVNGSPRALGISVKSIKAVLGLI